VIVEVVEVRESEEFSALQLGLQLNNFIFECSLRFENEFLASEGELLLELLGGHVWLEGERDQKERSFF